MIEYRCFQNSDPLQLVKLWHNCDLGRGAVADLDSEVLDVFNFGQPYFDPHGLILACNDSHIVGFVHAGFGCNTDGTNLSLKDGVLCAIMVHPDARRQGIGRELVARAERYLQASGATTIQAGPAEPRDPFYFGLYGGSQPVGFLRSDVHAATFWKALDYIPIQRHLIYQRNLNQTRDPVSIRLSNIRRKTIFVIDDHWKSPSWWWTTRFGRLESQRFQLIGKDGAVSEPFASVTILSLDLFLSKWERRAVGLSDLFVPEEHRRQGYGQTLVLEVGRRLQQESITCIEAHALDSNPAAIAVFESAGFEQVDIGVVYQRLAD